MDYTENEDDQNAVTKWPFYMAALFILSLVIGFAYLHLKVNQTLDQWQLTTCILASGLASILVFIPHLIDRFLALAFDPSKRKDEELHRKTYFDIKEMKSQLEAFSVKIDKVPTLVDKIVSDSQKQDPNPDPVLAQIPSDLKGMQNTLLQKIKDLEELIVQTPLLPEPDPAVTQMTQSIPLIQNSIESLSSEVKELQKLVQTLPTEFPQPLDVEKTDQVNLPELSEDGEEKEFSDESEPAKEEAEEEEIDFSPSVEVTEDDNPPSDKIEVEDREENNIEVEIQPDEAGAEEIKTPSPDQEDQEIEKVQEIEEEVEDEELNDNSNEDEGILQESVEESVPQKRTINEELPLDLPDPAETLRKVDAILKDTNPDKVHKFKTVEKEKEKEVPKKSSTGTTSVVAKVMIGIGNKPYLRGEGPGLSWDEGVPMNFVEIGKWAWSPSRKNASLTVQLYRNDNDPDKSGKIEVQAGEKIEITPDFG